MKTSNLFNLKPLILKQRKACKSPVPRNNTSMTQASPTNTPSHLDQQSLRLKIPSRPTCSPKTIVNEDDIMERLIAITDQAIEALEGDNSEYALQALQKVEKDLEEEAVEGKIIDRNLIIVCLYNMACVYQAMWSLEDCLKYLDAVIYNLKESLVQVLPNSASRSKLSARNTAKSNPPDSDLRAVKLRKQNLLLKVYLQQSAVLSQLGKHDDALSKVVDAQQLMEPIIQECIFACGDIKAESCAKTSPKDVMNCSYITLSTACTSGKTREAISFFKDEVSYTKNIFDHAYPFLKDLIKTIDFLSQATQQELHPHVKNSLSTWKASLEGRQKSPRKGVSKGLLFFPGELKGETRSLLGVQQSLDWLKSFNIDSIMRMTPLKYREYAQKRDIANDLSRESLQEKALYQSIIFFAMATEIRLLEGPNKQQTDYMMNKSDNNEAETYHLRAIEIACRYVIGPCAYIEHLATRYLKNYGQIPKRSATPLGQADQEAARIQELYLEHQSTDPVVVRASPTPQNLYESTKNKRPVGSSQGRKTEKSREHPHNAEYSLTGAISINKPSYTGSQGNHKLKRPLDLNNNKREDGDSASSRRKIIARKVGPQGFAGDVNSEEPHKIAGHSPGAPSSPVKNRDISLEKSLCTPVSPASNNVSPRDFIRDDKGNDLGKYSHQDVVFSELRTDLRVPTLKLSSLEGDKKDEPPMHCFATKSSSYKELGPIPEGEVQNKVNNVSQGKILHSEELKPQRKLKQIAKDEPKRIHEESEDSLRFSQYEAFDNFVKKINTTRKTIGAKELHDDVSGHEHKGLKSSKSKKLLTNHSKELFLIKAPNFPKTTRFASPRPINVREKSTRDKSLIKGNSYLSTRNNYTKLAKEKSGLECGTVSLESIE